MWVIGWVRRWGEEEFVILFPESDEMTARTVSEKLRNKIAQFPFKVIGNVTCSYGAAVYQTGQSAREILESADWALYHPITHKLALSIAGIGSFSGGDAQGEHLNPL